MKKKYIEEVEDLYTIKDILRWTISNFNKANIYYGHGTNNAFDEALQLILTSLYLPLNIPSNLLTSRITKIEKKHIINLISQRIKKKIPTAYLINRSWFCGHEFYIDKRVLIPRTPIKELINNRFTNIISNEPKSILDLCTGSGCIAISCAYKFPNTKIIDAVDISSDALIVAERNIINHKLQNSIILILSDLFKNMPEVKYDMIITNPPYVNKKDINMLPKEFLIEPKIALFADDDGLNLIYRILANSPRFLTNNGILICEVGNNMINLIKKYPEIKFNWLKFKYGGNGVFSITYKELIKHNKTFSLYIDS
ncbi:50S ribosomal protein L3 N(5)-glutamine methyltransferase [Candidatus Providencia siddallii]|uniref:50S ribosomal protein L3 glutamine methyltransferase n=1 Tax=Candidatus Providencia siddallii TaxID=1715285 RepID=A0ABM9NPY7_9GAMM